MKHRLPTVSNKMKGGAARIGIINTKGAFLMCTRAKRG